MDEFMKKAMEETNQLHQTVIATLPGNIRGILDHTNSDSMRLVFQLPELNQMGDIMNSLIMHLRDMYLRSLESHAEELGSQVIVLQHAVVELFRRIKTSPKHTESLKTCLRIIPKGFIVFGNNGTRRSLPFSLNRGEISKLSTEYERALSEEGRVSLGE